MKFKNKKYKFFDIPAKGFDSISPDQYLMMEESGQIPKLIYIPASSLSINQSIPGAGCFVNTQAKRLYVGNIPLSADEGEIVDFFNQMLELNCLRSSEPGPVVITAQLNHDKNFAFIELRSVDETSSAMTLDGVEFHGCALKIKRPRDYQPIQTWSISGDYESLPVNLQLRSLASADPNDGKIIISNLPQSYTELDVRTLVQIYGEVKTFELTRDSSTGKGSAFVEYINSSSADETVKNLDGSTVDGCTLGVTLAYKVNAAATGPILPGVASINVPGVDLKASTANPTNVLCMRNIVEETELEDDEEYEDILIDIRTECELFGQVLSIEIPRPQSGVPDVPGLGKVYVEYANVEGCKKAFENLSGRRFADRIVVVSFFDPENYQNRQFS